MDFKKLLNTYTQTLDTNERSNEFAEVAPIIEEELTLLEDFVSNYDSNEILEKANAPLQDTESPEELADIIDETPVETIPEDVLSILSELDNPAEFMQEDNEEAPIKEDITQNSGIDPFESINAEVENINDTDIEDFDSSALDLTTENQDDSSDFYEEATQEEGNLNPIEFNNEDSKPLDEFDNDLDSFLNNLNEDDTDSNIDNIFEEPSNSLEDIQSDVFDIELPEEFPQEEADTNIDDIEDSEDGESFLPDFSETELSNAQKETDIPSASYSIPTDYEAVDKSVNFDIWYQQPNNTTTQDTEFNIDEEQAFKIRYKINGLENKNLRFKIREIIAEPSSYPTYFSKLISMLLTDASESEISSLFDKLEEDQIGKDTVSYSSSEANHTPSFLAHDVVDYQDTIYNLRNEILYNFKKYALYGLIGILTGVIAWVGVAQPMRVNGLFERGLTAIRNSQFVEGEALFQQANNIAGSPVAGWFVKYADVYKDKNLVTEASQKYLSAIILEPKNIPFSIKASDFYTNLGPQYYSNAINIMDNISSFYPRNFEVWDRLGSLYIDYSDFFLDNRDRQTTLLYDAADIYQEYILNNPNNPAPFYRILEIYILIGNREQIDKIASLLASLNPKYSNIEMMTALAKYYIDHRELTRAEAIFRNLTPVLDANFKDSTPLMEKMQKLYNINPENISNIISESYFEFARYKMLSSDFRGAGLLLTNSILFNDQKYESYNLLGEAYLRSSIDTQEKLSIAKGLFDQSLELNPNNYKANANLGHMYYTWNNEFGDSQQAYDTALYYYKLAATLIPSNVKNSLLSYNYGWLEYQNDNPDRAIEIWSDIYKATPENPILSYALGSALYQADNPQLAQSILEKSAASLEDLRKNVPFPDLNNRRHIEMYMQLTKTYNNLGVIYANYGQANINRQEEFDAQALLNFYKAQDLADKINTIYSTVEYNIGTLTRPNIRRQTIFDNDIPKQTSLENPVSQFNRLLLDTI